MTLRLFAWLLMVGSKRKMELFDYEFSPVPEPIIDEYGCIRKCIKSVIFTHHGILVDGIGLLWNYKCTLMRKLFFLLLLHLESGGAS